MTATWHPGPTALAAYAAQAGGPTLAASVEQHLLRCASCRTDIAPHASQAVVALGRDRLQHALVRRSRPRVLRVAEWFGLPEDSATLLAESRTMSDAWMMSMVVVLGLAALADSISGYLGEAILLVVAPLLPVVGVALVYGNTEPSLERIARAAPYSSVRLVLLRCAGVIVSIVPIALGVAGIAAASGHGISWLQAVALLLPALACTVLVLALATWVSVEVVAAAVALGWTFVVGAACLQGRPAALVASSLQPLYLALAATAVGLLLVQVRRGHVPGGIG